MSRMTKFLRQKCSVQPYKVTDEGAPKFNAFGELEYEQPVVLKCRHEVSFKDVQTYNGQLIKSTSRYFFDDGMPIKADYLVDGRAVLEVSTYVNSLGYTEGYEVYV